MKEFLSEELISPMMKTIVVSFIIATSLKSVDDVICHDDVETIEREALRDCNYPVHLAKIPQRVTSICAVQASISTPQYWRTIH